MDTSPVSLSVPSRVRKGSADGASIASSSACGARRRGGVGVRTRAQLGCRRYRHTCAAQTALPLLPSPPRHTCFTNSWWKKGTASWPRQRRTSPPSPLAAYSCRGVYGWASGCVDGSAASAPDTPLLHMALPPPPAPARDPAPSSARACSMLRTLSLVSSNLNPAPLPQQRARRSALQHGRAGKARASVLAGSRLLRPRLRPPVPGGAATASLLALWTQLTAAAAPCPLAATAQHPSRTCAWRPGAARTCAEGRRAGSRGRRRCGR